MTGQDQGPAQGPAPTLDQLTAAREGRPVEDGKRLEKQHRFMLRYRMNPHMPPVEGYFTVRASTLHDRMRIESLKVSYAGAPWNSLSFEGQVLFESMAVCQVVLVESPEWFKVPLDRLTPDIVVAVANEWRAYEAAYFRQGAEGSDPSPAGPLVEVVEGLGTRNRPA